MELDPTVDSLSIREHIERLMPPGSHGRRMVGWGVVAWSAIATAALVWIFARALSRVAGIFPYLVVAGMVVLVLNPAVKRLQGRGLPRRLAASIVFALALGVTVLVLVLLIPALIRQGQELVTSSPGLVRKGGGLFDGLKDSSNPLLHQAGTAISNWLNENAGSAPKALRTVSIAGLQLAHAGLVLLVGGFLGLLLLLSLSETRRGLMALIPPGSREKLGPPVAEVRRIVAGYVRARLIVSAVVGLLATAGLWAIHMPYWLLLGIIVGAANLVPMLGSVIGGVPVALVAVLTKPPSFLIAAIAVITVAHAVDGYILSPIILRETTNLHPVVILLAVLLGADLLGLWGILAAIPVVGVANFMVREWILSRWTGTEPPEEPPPIGEVATGVPG